MGNTVSTADDETYEKPMAIMIEKFSDEQLSLIDQRLSDWRDAALCTKPVDRALTEQHIENFYGLNGFEKPAVVWCDSPWQMAALAFVLQIINRSGREKSCKRWLKSQLSDPLFRAVWDKYDEASDSFDRLVRTPRESALLDSDESKELKVFLELAMFEQQLHVDDEIDKHITGEVRESLELKVQSVFQDALWGAIERPLEAELQIRLKLLGNRLASSLSSQILSQKLSQSDSSTLNSFRNARATTGDGAVGGAFSQSRLSSDLLARAVILPPIVRKKNFYAHNFLNSNLPFEIAKIVSHINFPWHDDATPLVHRLCCELLGNRVEHLLEKEFSIEVWFEHMKSCLAILPLGNVCLVCDRPSKLEVDQWNRLHCTDGPAIDFPDGYCVYSWHGNVVESWFITDPKRISLSEIESEKNTARRRILIEVFGEARFLTEAGAIVQDESDFGVLFRKELPDDDDLVMVKVTNSTMDPDGTWKSYYLRVPPSIKTAKEAIAWTFDMQVDEYSPLLES